MNKKIKIILLIIILILLVLIIKSTYSKYTAEAEATIERYVAGWVIKVNDTDITNRIPQVNVSPLNNNGTTAIYKHPKTPISVAIGDIVEYTIRVYNEAEIDGYAEEIIDHLPDQLEFLPDNETNKTYKWTVDNTNSKIIRTTYYQN